MVESYFETINLFRSDINPPPDQWSDTFKNPSYSKDRHGEFGNKNANGFYFFVDSSIIANRIGRLAAEKNNSDGYYFTTCKLLKKVNIIDFSGCDDVYKMIQTLQDENINVLTDEYKVYLNPSLKRTFKEYFEDPFNQIKLLRTNSVNDSIDIFKSMEKLKIEHCGHCESAGLFGQNLTDFDNGLLFKNELLARKIDGYKFREDCCQEGLTYCFLSSNVLSSPETSFVRL